MNVVGIIAEYNPFHNGHQYQLEEAKRITGADKVIIIMSGNFVQRGAPALLDKYTRTQMALSCGADLVLELPLYYSCGSAEYFAKGAISLLHKLGVVDSLCFGSECGDIALLTQVAELLANPSPALTASIKNYLKEGNTFPKARALALADSIAGDPSSAISDEKARDMAQFLSSPNNILGIEYIKALISCKSTITPVTISRKGADYHATALTVEHSSARAIRHALSQIDPFMEAGLVSSAFQELRTQVPSSVFHLMQESFQQNFPIYSNDLSKFLHYKLLAEVSTGYDAYMDVSTDFSDRICNQLPAFQNFEQFCECLKTKDRTYTGTSRCLLHILLNITKENMNNYLAHGITPYARMLGFRTDAKELLSAIKKSGTIPLLSKLANAREILGQTYKTPYASHMLEEEITASHIYNSLAFHKYQAAMRNEYQQKIIMV